MLTVLAVTRGSIAEELELESGDRLLTINGSPVRDIIDYRLLTTDEELLLEVEKKDGELWDLEIEKGAHDPLGLEFPPPEPTQCGNNCLFCFVHQLPKGMRRSLYVKDEDFRFSFLYGSYVTLSNIGEQEIERILEQRLSPLYVSVHATEPELRSRLLGRKVPPILDLLRRLVRGGIVLHTQIVVCPGINDGSDLRRTIRDLAELHPGLASLAVVPVGLTGYREHLPDLRPPTPAEAAATLDLVQEFQSEFLERFGSRFVFAADEYFLLARRDLPPLEAYEDLEQLENGVGLLALFRRESADALAAAEPLNLTAVSVVTGVSAWAEVDRYARELSRLTKVPIHLLQVENRFFGGEVTVTGLLTGKDLVEQLRGKALGAALLIPDVMLREGTEQFLDGMTLTQLGRELQVPARAIPSCPQGLLDGLRELSGMSPATEHPP